MRLIVISDIHLHPWAAFSRGTGLNNTRFQQTLKVVRDSLQAAREDQAVWVCAGDFVHTISFTNNFVLNSLIDLLSEYPDVAKLAVWGNHDSRGKGRRSVTSEEAVTHSMERAVENFTVLQGQQVYIDPLVFFGCGAQPDHSLTAPVAPVDVGVFHTMVTGSETGTGFELEGLDAAEVMRHCRVAIVGDVHQPQLYSPAIGYINIAEETEQPCAYNVPKDSHTLLIPGSPEQHSFGDRGAHGYWTVDFEEHSTVLTLWESDSPKFLTVETVEEVGERHFYRVIQPTNILPANAMAMGSPPTTVEQRDVLTGLGHQEVLERWLELHPPPQDEKEYLLNGMRLLESADLLEVQPARIKWIQAKDFMSYEAFNYKVEDGVTLVVGESKDFSSNGAGKSTLFEALYWTLFGKTTKDVGADEVIRWGAKSCEAIVRIEIGGKDLVVRRKRAKGAVTLTATYGDEDVVGASARDMTDQIIRLIGVTPDVFRALAYYSQEKLLLFSQATDAERKSLLADLAGLGAYQTASETAGSGYRTQDEKYRLADHSATTLKVRAEGLVEKLQEARQREHEWEIQRTVQADELEQELKEVEAEIEVETQQREERLKRYNKHHDQWVDAQRHRMEALIPNWERDYAREADKVEEEMVRLGREPAWEGGDGTFIQEKLSSLERRVEKGMEEVGELEAQSRACPVCEQMVPHPDVKKARWKVSEDQKKLRAAQDLWKEYQFFEKRHADWERQVSTLRAMGDDYRRRAHQLAVQKSEALIGALLNRGRARHARVHLWTERARERNLARLSPIQRALETLAGQVNPETSAVDALQREVDGVMAELVTARNEVEEALRRRAVYAYWQQAFSKQGIQSLLLEGIAAAFNLHRSMIFPMLTHGVYDVQFSTVSFTAEGERRERSDFFITYHGDPVPYANLSGGQRRRIDVGVLLTLALANATTRQVPGVLGTLILDEVFDFLDTDGAESLVDVLDHVQKTIPAIFVITQDAEMQSLFRDTLLVEQGEDGVSRLVQ